MERRLRRSTSDRWLAGVCGGIAEFTGLDATLVRLAFVAFGILGVGELVYLIMWVVVPKS